MCRRPVIIPTHDEQRHNPWQEKRVRRCPL